MAIAIRTSLADVELPTTYVKPEIIRPEKSEGGKPFVLKSDYVPAGDQPTAIRELCASTLTGERDQVLLGVTGCQDDRTIAAPGAGAGTQQDARRPAV
jgi:excinuclease ABC subunit B